jgi:restriction system protein
VGWARTYLTKAGLLERSRRGQYRITERGKTAIEQNPSRIDNRYLQQFPEFQEFQRGRAQSGLHETPSSFPKTSESGTVTTPDEAIRAAHAELENALAQELLSRILEQTPAFFERLVVQLLGAMGFGGSVEGAGRALGKSGDGGVDGVIDQDALGLDRIYVQAKRYVDGNTVGASAIRDFFGSLDRFKAAKGLFVTTSNFTKDARDTAASLSKRIVLIDGEQLVRLMIRYGVGCRVEDTLYLKKIDEDFFE